MWIGFCNRRIPYEVAMKRGHVACAALLNPSSAEPLVWPSPLKFISELEPDAKALLEAALMEANREREKRILKGAKSTLPSPSRSDDSTTISEVPSVLPSLVLQITTTLFTDLIRSFLITCKLLEITC
jgi:hypothetical protein